MAINNLNPRRVVWFSPNEPSNKYDIWLSRNAHYNENGEPTTDSNSQRDCDYIFKIYDCGKWNPIVGFNTTAANKIDTVTGVDYTIDGVTHSGKNVYHPAIFTAESPNELYDAGSLGELLKDTHFVTEGDWNDIYNEYIKTIIELYPFDLWPAEQNELGGIFADRFASTHIDSTVANKTWMAQCKYKYNASSNYNLYIHAKDIISAVNDYQTDHPNEPGIEPGGDFEFRLATILNIGGIRCQTDSYNTDYFGVPVVFGGYKCGLTYDRYAPNGITVWGDDVNGANEDNSFLYVPNWALNEWIKDPNGNGTTLPFTIDPGSITIALNDILKNTSSIGWSILSTSSNPTISPEIYGITNALAGKYLRIKPDFTGGIPEGGWNQSNCAVEWVDLPEGTVYTQGTGITISQQNKISIDTTNASTNQVLTKTANGVGWSTPSLQIQYTGTNLIKVNSNNNEIGIDMDSTPSAGDIIICDGTGRDVVAKWGAVPNPNLAIINVECGSGDLTLTNNILSVRNGSFTINNESYASDSYVLNEWAYYTVSSYKTLAITSMKLTANPIYMRFSPRTSVSNFTCVGDVIDAQGVLTDTNFYKDAFVTLQFGVAKFEKVETAS